MSATKWPLFIEEETSMNIFPSYPAMVLTILVYVYVVICNTNAGLKMMS